MATRFVGYIKEKSEINVTKTKEKAVINFTISKTREIVEGILETVKARVVLFGAEAEEAAVVIKEGDVVLFSEVRRNPRMFTTEAGTLVESVDLVARSFQVIPKSRYEAAKVALEKECISLSELEFTDADREAQTKTELALEASVA